MNEGSGSRNKIDQGRYADNFETGDFAKLATKVKREMCSGNFLASKIPIGPENDSAITWQLTKTSDLG